MIKAAFFDLDETLINAENAHKKATEMAFSHFGYDYQIVRKSSPQYFSMGKRVSDNLKARRDGAGISEDKIPLNELYKVREKYFLELFQEEGMLMPGAQEILKKMKELNKIVAIVSSGTEIYLHLVMKKFLLNEYINFIIAGDDVVKGKPDPECYLKAFNKALTVKGDLHQNECLVFEDTEAGVIAGKKAGMKVVYIPTPVSIPPQEIMPDYTILSLTNFEYSSLSEK